MVSTSPVFYDNQQPLPRFLIKRQVFSGSLPHTEIGADVWIGQSALVLAGVKIGTGAVIGAGSVVTKDVPPYAVAVGNPCRVRRFRFDQGLCRRLLDSRWWEMDERTLEGFASSFLDPVQFLVKLEAHRSVADI
jgi:hypothetical protein